MIRVAQSPAIPAFTRLQTQRLAPRDQDAIKPIAHCMCMLHERSWDFEGDDDVQDWLVDLILNQDIDPRARPGPTQTNQKVLRSPTFFEVFDQPITIPRIWSRMLMRRPDVMDFLRDGGQRTDSSAYLRMTFWFFTFGVAEHGLVKHVQPLFLDSARTNDHHLPLLWQSVWSTRDDLQREFDIRRSEGRERFMAWAKASGLDAYPSLKELFLEANAKRSAGSHG